MRPFERDTQAIGLRPCGKPEHADSERLQLAVIDKHSLICGVSVVVEKIRVFHQIVEFLAIASIENFGTGSALLTAFSSKSSQYKRLGWKVFWIGHTKEPFQNMAEGPRNISSMVTTSILQV